MEACACGQTDCYIDIERPMRDAFAIDGKTYTLICGIGLLHRRSEVLKWYADPANWAPSESGYREPPAAPLDAGQRARKALGRD